MSRRQYKVCGFIAVRLAQGSVLLARPRCRHKHHYWIDLSASNAACKATIETQEASVAPTGRHNSQSSRKLAMVKSCGDLTHVPRSLPWAVMKWCVERCRPEVAGSSQELTQGFDVGGIDALPNA